MNWKKFDKATDFLFGVSVGMVIIVLVILWRFGGIDGVKIAGKAASVFNVVKKDYVGDYDVQALADDAASAIIDGLDDHWSYYMDEEFYELYKSLSSNSYRGIGVTVHKDEESGGFFVNDVTAGGPAQLAGISAGDIILSVDGVDVTGSDIDALKELIGNGYGRDIVVGVLHEDGQEEEYTVSCEDVYTNPVSAELLEGGVGYISIANFEEGSADSAIAAVEDMMDAGAESLLFDVRSNPGGLVKELCKLLDYLLPEGDIFIRADKKGHEVTETSDADCVELPMAVLVNGDSYSAAEFFAAVLREYGVASIVGEQTTGKARSQITVSFSDGTAVHISKYSYLTPNRVNLYEAGGLTPDAEILLTEEEWEAFDAGELAAADDPQLQAAAELLSE